MSMLFQNEFEKIHTRRTFLAKSTASLGAFALASLFNEELLGKSKPGVSAD
jgi:hypothetical protein